MGQIGKPEREITVIPEPKFDPIPDPAPAPQKAPEPVREPVPA